MSSRLLATLLLIIHLLICHWFISRTHSLLNDHPSSITASITFLSQSCWVHLTSCSSWINWVFFNSLVDSIVISTLYHSSMLITYSLSSCELLKSSKIWIVLRRYQLSLHCIGDRLVPVISNSGCILNTVWHYGSYSIWIHPCLCTHEVQSTGQVQIAAKVI